MQSTQTRTSNLPQPRDPFQTLFTRLFGDSLAEFYGNESDGNLPRTNISETDKGYELSFELPGIKEQDIQVQLHDKTLTVTAERKDDREQDGKRWHRAEHRYGHYSRAITLPQDAANDGIDAVHESGVLTVIVPKQPQAQPAKIAVRAR